MALDKKRKRSQEAPAAAASAAKSSSHSKRPKPDVVGNPTPSALHAAKEEESAFPRGGAPALTPLEYKEVTVKADRDVLFGEAGAAADGAAGEGGEGKPSKRKPKRDDKKKGHKGQKGEHTKEKVDTGPKVEGLSYKRLATGSLVLGCIEKINKTDIALSLPNNLTGFIPLTRVSEMFTSKLEALAAAEYETDEEDGSGLEEDEDEEKQLGLASMFRVGQYLRAYVLHTTEQRTAESKNERAQTKKRIELSLYPSLANTGLKKDDLVVGCTVQASVKSVEDHGLVMDLGLEDDMKGFLATKELGPDLSVAKAREGQVLLCTVTGQSSNGKIVKLSTDLEQKPSKKGKLPGGKGSWWLSQAPTIDTFLPGTGVEVLVTEVGKQGGVVGKIMGMLDAVIDYFHVVGWDKKDLESRFKPGNKIKARVIATFPNSDPKKVGLSILPHVLSFTPASENDALTALPIATIIESAKIVGVEPNVGLFVDVGVPGVPGFVHISRISSESKIEALSKDEGAYKLGATRPARILGFNPMDGLYVVSMEKRILEQPYLRIDDIEVGTVVKGKIEKVLDRGAITVGIADGISGIVEELHLSDIKLKHPEKKFREGLEVKARVLAKNPARRKLHLTLKKTLVNSDAPIIDSYEAVEPGMQSVGTLVNVLSNGAVVLFYSGVRAFLPVAEMSEAYIKDPREHFRVGQSVNVHVVYVDVENKQMRVSCKDPNTFGEAQKAALAKLKPGQLVSGTISEKNSDDVVVDLNDVGATGLKGTLAVGHLTDGSREKNMNKFTKLRAGQKLGPDSKSELVIIQASESKRMVRLSMKPSLVEAAKNGTLTTSFEQVNEGMKVKGYFKNGTDFGVFMAFAGGLTGLILKKHLPDEIQSLPNFGYHKDQSLTATVKEVDHAQQKFLLTMKPTETAAAKTGTVSAPDSGALTAVDAVDGHAKTINDFFPGKVTKARIVSVQQTQINVQLADNIQGRIDVSQLFDSLEAIENRKQPLQGYKKGDVLNVKVIGIHDARNHRFLPITHRTSNTKTPIFELTAKPSDLKTKSAEVLTLGGVAVGSTWLAFVNNITPECVWVNISPGVRGRIRLLELSEDVTQLKDPDTYFPVGSMLKCYVLNVDIDHGKLDLSARSAATQRLTFDRLSKGMVVPGRVTKVTDRQAIVQLSDFVSGHIGLTDLSDDYDKVKMKDIEKNDIVRVCVLDIDASNKRVSLSARPSKVLDSSLPVRDPEIQTVANVNVGDLRRGFVKNVSDKGLFVSLGGNVTAWVKISDLSDTFLKDWKSKFQVDQLVEGRIIAVEQALNRVTMSLRESAITGKPPRRENKALSEFNVGQVVTGKIKKVAEYGVFIAVDGAPNVSGLCHKTEIADKKVDDVSKLYAEGEPVKAKILNVDLEKRRISFGLKASYFQTANEEGDDSDSEEDGGMALNGAEDDGASSDDGGDLESDDGGIDLTNIKDFHDGAGQDQSDSDVEMADVPVSSGEGLQVGDFDWTGSNIFEKRAHETDSDSDSDEADNEKQKKKRRKKSEIKQDLTASLNSNHPKSVSDFERLLLSDPNNSQLWIQYMAFQLQLSELERAREIAKQALKTISIREETEKLNVWTAMLNMENVYGNDESLQETFKQACQYNDAKEVHERLASIFIQSGKTDKAEDLFKTAVKKFSQDPKVWLNFADFCLTNNNRKEARDLLNRALQALPKDLHRDLVTKFAILEFRTGDAERGRTLFETLLETYSKRMDLWNVFLDIEMKYGGEENKDQVRDLFKRATKKEQCKPKQAKWLFKKWSEYEKKHGDEKKVAEVTERARKWVEERSAAKSGETEE